jgi:SAM-dependent methyltransferase
MRRRTDIASYPDCTEDSYLEGLRRRELDAVRKWFRPGMKVLEIGGDTGFQSAILAAWGCQVMSLDIDVLSGGQRYFDVVQYDGLHLPAADAAFDAIYSSHMLYYELDTPEFFAELRRVLKPAGLAIHIMPTSVWRVATCLTYYPYAVKRALVHLARLAGETSRFAVTASPNTAVIGAAATRRKWWRWLFAGPLGPAPSACAEFLSWRRTELKRLFTREAFEIIGVCPLRLFYTGYELFSNSLPFGVRRLLSGALGSGSAAYVTRRATGARMP